MKMLFFTSVRTQFPQLTLTWSFVIVNLIRFVFRTRLGRLTNKSKCDVDEPSYESDLIAVKACSHLYIEEQQWL